VAYPGLAPRAQRLTASPITRSEIAAIFLRRSYRPGEWAGLRVWARTRELSLQVFECGSGRQRAACFGEPVTRRWIRAWSFSPGPRTIHLKVRHWHSGLYLIRLRSRDGRVGYAPLVVHPSHPSARTAVVFPTNTWQAYNFRDMNGDGVGDTWYADPSIHTVDLTRPYPRPGTPWRIHRARLNFVRWFHRHRKTADFYADDDFAHFPSGRWLASHYTLLVFSGHEEYVTPREYDLVQSYRNRGGNLAFLSANNFFFRVTRAGATLHGRTRWRDLGRPEAALVGVQYVGWWQKVFRPRPYVLTGARTARWLYAGTGLANGDSFGRFGNEIDARAPSSPPRTLRLALARDIFGPGKSAEMTYYATSRGARVFAAGVLNFTAGADWAIVDRMIANVFARLERR
jgi:hypothetical protein